MDPTRKNKEEEEERKRNGFVCHTSNTRARTKPMSNKREIDTIYQRTSTTIYYTQSVSQCNKNVDVIHINSCAVCGIKRRVFIIDLTQYRTRHHIPKGVLCAYV